MKFLAVLLALIYTLTFANALNFDSFTIQVKDCPYQTVQINQCASFCSNQVYAKITSVNSFTGSFYMEYYMDSVCNTPAYNENSQLMKFPFICLTDGQVSPVDNFGDNVVCHAKATPSPKPSESSESSESSSSSLVASVSVAAVAGIVAALL